MERFASCVFCGGHTVFCVVVVTKVKDSYLMNKKTVLAPADGWPVEGPRSETRQFDNSLLHDLNPEANQTKYKTLFQSYFSYFLRIDATDQLNRHWTQKQALLSFLYVVVQSKVSRFRIVQ